MYVLIRCSLYTVKPNKWFWFWLWLTCSSTGLTCIATQLGCFIILSSHMWNYRALCSLFQPDTDGTRVSKCRQLSLRKHENLTQCCFNIGPGPLVGVQYWNNLGSNHGVCWAPHRCLFTPTPLLHDIFASRSGYFYKSASLSQAYYNTWNWEWGTYDVTHLQILTCEVAVSTAGSVHVSWPRGGWWR